jgi:phenylacetate-CoA ligase
LKTRVNALMGAPPHHEGRERPLLLLSGVRLLRKDFHDSLETRDPEEREEDLLGRLPDLIALALSMPGWARRLGAVDPNTMTSRGALARLPLLRSDDLRQAQADDPPFGGLANMPRSKLRRVLMSPGPVFHPQARGRDWGGAARALFAAGIRSSDLVLNAFSHHLAPEGFIMESGAHALGCAVIAAGQEDVVQALDVVRSLKPTAYVGSVSFLKQLLEAAGGDAMTLRHGLVAGTPLTQDDRKVFDASGIAVQECLLHPDLGVIAYESDAREGLIVNEGLIVEIVRPGTSEPVAAGEIGEIVVTSFNPDYPMIRFATGLLSSVLRGRSPCSRTNMRVARVA